MTRIGLLSDTHDYLDPEILRYFKECDEIWHAGDIGDLAITDKLEALHPVRAVYGNIDDHVTRRQFPENQVFTVDGVKVCMTHIAGRPGRYPARVKELLLKEKPKIFICGHSHILKVINDKSFKVLHINPGACGMIGLHKMRTVIRFTLDNGNIRDLDVVELGPRGLL